MDKQRKGDRLMEKLEIMEPQDLEAPVCSSDQIWYKDDMNLSLSAKLDTVETECVHSINQSVKATSSNGSFVVSPSFNLVDNCAYIVTLQYAKSNALVDRSTYAFRYNASTKLQSTVILTNCSNGNDSLIGRYDNGKLTLMTTYNGTDIPTEVTIRFI